jgi:hypothetical protein
MKVHPVSLDDTSRGVLLAGLVLGITVICTGCESKTEAPAPMTDATPADGAAAASAAADAAANAVPTQPYGESSAASSSASAPTGSGPSTDKPSSKP